ncbi:cupin domain-containing protein [Gordonia humi]|uniref:cupin domain-containing protein n=1 Tax=Gordonia humi TaxID=686429 RepID=UPI00361C6632
MYQVPGRLATTVPENSIRFLGHATHSHDEPHLVYVASGSARLTIDGEQVCLDAQESVWLAPGVPHSARYSPAVWCSARCCRRRPCHPNRCTASAASSP